MPEVRELADALPDASMDPITGVGVVASRNRAPTSYDVVSSSVTVCVLNLNSVECVLLLFFGTAGSFKEMIDFHKNDRKE